MKKVFNKLKSHWITIWLVLALISTAIIVINAAYLGNKDVKRVVSTASISDVYFSSNILTGSGIIKNIRTANTSSNYQCVLSVYNYDEMNPTNYAKEDIRYKLTAKLVSYDRDSEEFSDVTETLMKTSNPSNPKVFTITKTKDENENCSEAEKDLNTDPYKVVYEGESLGGGGAFSDTYTLTFDMEEVAKDLPELYIYVIAEPVSDGVTGTVSTQSGYISVSKGIAYTSGWHGSLTENDNQAYDAYNMIISGSGAGKIDVKWDSEKFEISKSSLELYEYSNETETGFDRNGIETANGKSTITLYVNSVISNRYEIQFYKKVSGDYNISDVDISCSRFVSN